MSDASSETIKNRAEGTIARTTTGAGETGNDQTHENRTNDPDEDVETLRVEYGNIESESNEDTGSSNVASPDTSSKSNKDTTTSTTKDPDPSPQNKDTSDRSETSTDATYQKELREAIKKSKRDYQVAAKLKKKEEKDMQKAIERSVRSFFDLAAKRKHERTIKQEQGDDGEQRPPDSIERQHENSATTQTDTEHQTPRKNPGTAAKKKEKESSSSNDTSSTSPPTKQVTARTNLKDALVESDLSEDDRKPAARTEASPGTKNSVPTLQRRASKRERVAAAEALRDTDPNSRQNRMLRMFENVRQTLEEREKKQKSDKRPPPSPK